MGCGCNKNRSNRGERLKRDRKLQFKSLKREHIVNRLSYESSFITKSSICMSCPESLQNTKERKRGIKVCRKTNRLINNIIRDLKFICPLGKWRNIK